MRILRSFGTTFLCALVLAACGESGAPGTGKEEVGAAPSEPATIEAPAPSQGAWPAEFYDADDTALTQEEIVGMWSTAPNCAQPTVFMADGTYTDQTGYTGRWTLNGGQLSLARQHGTYINEVNQFDANTFAAGPSSETSAGALRTFVIYRRC